MFTGIIEATAAVLDKAQNGLILERPSSFNDLRIGSSISVSGACLSVVAMDEKTMRFDVVDETLAKTNLGSLQKGDRVNLERSLKLGDRVDGHHVQGHVEGTGEVIRDQRTETREQRPENREQRTENSELVIRLPHAFMKSVVPKGSIAIDGVSLTVAKIEGDQITIALIPHTLENTTLGSLKKGTRVNIETDILLRTNHAH